MPLRRLFVYGSLRRTFPNHGELSGAECLGSLLTEARYALIERDGYPALVSGNVAIPGELYAVTAEQLARLDEFEGDGYVRRLVHLADGSTADAYWLAHGVE